VIEPTAQYDHDEGIAVIGGFVYRGSKIKSLRGRYVFGDYLRSFTNSTGRIFHLANRVSSSTAINPTLEFNLQGGQSLAGYAVLGFAQDHHKELYVLANVTGTPFQNAGVVWKISPVNDDDNEDDDNDD
jgi:hypothetical protein